MSRAPSLLRQLADRSAVEQRVKLLRNCKEHEQPACPADVVLQGVGEGASFHFLGDIPVWVGGAGRNL